MQNRHTFHPVSTKRTLTLTLILFLFGFTLLSAQGKSSKGLELIDKDKAAGLITDEEALVQKFYYGFNKSKLDDKYFFENDIPGKCGTGILVEYRQKKDLLSQSSINKIESCINTLRKRSITESTYISPSGKFELTYSTEGRDSVSAEDADSSGVPDYVERIANYFDYSWNFVVDTLGYLPPPVGNEKYQISFENSGYFGYTDVLQGRLTYISMSSTFDGFSDNTDPEGDAIGAAKVTAIHEFMHACQIVYNNWSEPLWFSEAHATWVEDIGYDYVNDYYNYLSGSNIKYPDRSLTSGDGYSDCIFMHCLTQKYGMQVPREIFERTGINGWEADLNSIDAVLSNYNASLEQFMPEYFSWCYLTGENADSRLPSFEEAADYPTSYANESSSLLPFNINNLERSELSAAFYEYTLNETDGNLSLEFDSDNKGYIALITSFKDSSVDIQYYTYSSQSYYRLIDTEHQLKDITGFVIIPVNTNVSDKLTYNISVDKYREVVFNHTPLTSAEDISPKTFVTKILTKQNDIDLNALKLNYKFGSEQFKTLPLFATGNLNEYSTEITDISDGDTISYYFSYYDSLRSFNNTLPLNAPDSLFSFMCGVDNIAPTISHNAVTSLTKEDFPRKVFAYISDNYKVASAYIEYSVNDEDINRVDFIKLKDSLYYAPLFYDTTDYNIDDKISYRIVASDSAITNNTTIYPDSGFVNLTLNRGYKYISDVNSYIDGWSMDEYLDTLYIEENITIRDLNLFFQMSFLNNEGFLLSLASPNGELVDVSNIQSSSCDSLSVVFNESADFDLTSSDLFLTGENYLTGHFKPEPGSLETFNGLSARGVWILHIYNQSWINAFTLDNWGLILQTDPVVSDIEEQNNNGIPTDYSLSNNYPNPFKPRNNNKLFTTGKK